MLVSCLRPASSQGVAFGGMKGDEKSVEDERDDERDEDEVRDVRDVEVPKRNGKKFGRLWVECEDLSK